MSDPRSIPRLGARRLATGAGRYLDDVEAGDALQAAFVRSPEAHARVRGIDTTRALELPGVVAVWTAADLAAMGGRPIPIGWNVPGQRPGGVPLLAGDRVRFVGDAVAVVVASDRYVAEDGCDLVSLDLEPLAVVADLDAALEGASLVHPDWGDNVLLRTTFGTGDPDAAFATAHVTVAARFEIARQTGVPMETRGCIARPDDATGELVLMSSAQSPHHSAEHLAAALGRDPQSVRVLVPDVGGSFGVKDHACGEEAVVALAALHLGRPVGWVQDRAEHLLAGVHARAQRYDIELAADADGRMLALRGRLLFDAGAWAGNHGAGTAVYSGLMLPGPYALEHYRLDLLALATNRPPTAAYRGYGGPEAAFAMEGLVDELARALGADPVDVRRRNLIPATAYPYRTASGCVYDAGDPVRALDRALELADVALPPPPEGSTRGRGVAAFVLMGGFGPTRAALDAGMTFGGHDSARVSIDRDGHVTVAIGMPTAGQGVETALAQIAAAALGVDPRAAVTMDSSDTASAPVSPVGAIASRGAVVGGAAVAAAGGRLAEQLRRMAAVLLECAPGDVVLRDGLAARGEEALVLGAVAAAIHRGHLPLEPGEVALEGSATVDPEAETFSYGAHVATVDVDAATGAVRVVHYAAVSDCGWLVNPAIVRGQVEGAIVQGLGGALTEELAYDAGGRPRGATLFDYVLPVADDVPEMAIELFETPSPVTPTGARGAGEVGIIAPGAAIANAVADALGCVAGTRHLPMTPPRVFALASTAREQRDAPGPGSYAGAQGVPPTPSTQEQRSVP
jgi:carbon-monoxide dehydrogenase large subunit